MPSEIIIRSFKASDRKSIREICVGTANCGKSIDDYFTDKELIADLVTSYYTDHEPQSTFVADRHGEIVGYLTGCLNQNKFDQVLVTLIQPLAIGRAILRGTLFKSKTWRVLWAGFLTLICGGYFKKINLNEYPAHFHIDIIEKFRGKNVGMKLMEKFYEYLASQGLKGVHAIARSDNKGACLFFEKMGFKIISEHQAYFSMPQGILKGSTYVFGKVL